MYVIDHLLPLCLAALACGALGGYGGRWAALWQLRGELHALASTVDPKKLAELGQVAAELESVRATAEGAARSAKSISGQLGQMVKAEKLNPADVEMLVGLVMSRLRTTVMAHPRGVSPE